MARPRNVYPTYRHHKPTNTARCWVNGEWVNLGKYNSAESHREFNRIHAQCALQAGSPRPLKPYASDEHTIAVVVLAYMRYAAQYYRRPNGTPTNEVDEMKRSLAMLRDYDDVPGSEFGPADLEVVREEMVAADWCRKLVNKRIGRIRRFFKWAERKQNVRSGTYGALRLVDGLKAGRCAARESPRILPADPIAVEKTSALLGRHLRTMIALQRYTGMRPGEVCAMSLTAINRTRDVWEYRPEQHKTAHHGKERVILIGPKGRAVLEKFITESGDFDPAGPLFSPRRAREERYALMRAKRKTRVQPSQANRKKKKPKKLPAMAYTPNTYAQSVRTAAEKAGVDPWHPNRLRHLYATEVRQQHGLEAAQVLLGHASANTTLIYAERDLALAAAVAAKVG